MKLKRSFFLHPFERIGGLSALLYGMSGKFLAILIAIATQVHLHGLLYYGRAPRSEWWIHTVEHLVIWLVPATLIYTGGVIFSKSRIRIIDVFGTVAFAQLPLLLMLIMYLYPPLQPTMKTMPQNLGEMTELMSKPGLMIGVSVNGVVAVICATWMLIWLYNAVKVSCNLKGGRLWGVYLIAIVGVNIVSRMLIGLMYKA